MFLIGGGSTESIFRNAPPGSVRERVWDKILSKSDSFRLPLNSVLFTSFLSDPKGVAFVPAFFVMANMGRDPGKACDLALKRVSLRPFSMIARPGFPYASLLDDRLKALQENGVADWLVKSYLLPVTSEKGYICSRIEVCMINRRRLKNVLRGKQNHFALDGRSRERGHLLRDQLLHGRLRWSGARRRGGGGGIRHEEVDFADADDYSDVEASGRTTHMNTGYNAINV